MVAFTSASSLAIVMRNRMNWTWSGNSRSNSTTFSRFGTKLYLHYSFEESILTYPWPPKINILRQHQPHHINNSFMLLNKRVCDALQQTTQRCSERSQHCFHPLETSSNILGLHLWCKTKYALIQRCTDITSSIHFQLSTLDILNFLKIHQSYCTM